MKFLDPNRVCTELAKRGLPGWRVYVHGPMPDYVGRFVNVAVVAPYPVRNGPVDGAVNFTAVFSVFDSHRTGAEDNANELLFYILECFRNGSAVDMGDGAQAYLSSVYVDALPSFENDELVNEYQIYRTDFRLTIVARYQ